MMNTGGCPDQRGIRLSGQQVDEHVAVTGHVPPASDVFNIAVNPPIARQSFLHLQQGDWDERETALRVVVGNDGSIITAFPVKP